MLRADLEISIIAVEKWLNKRAKAKQTLYFQYITHTEVIVGEIDASYEWQNSSIGHCIYLKCPIDGLRDKQLQYCADLTAENKTDSLTRSVCGLRSEMKK